MSVSADGVNAGVDDAANGLLGSQCKVCSQSCGHCVFKVKVQKENGKRMDGL